MSNIADDTLSVTGGVDTHADTHVAAVIDQIGRILGTESFPVSASGYQAALAWMHSHGQLELVGVEGTGSYGAGLARYLAEQEVPVVEVNRPNRQARRRRGKSDPADAISAAESALNGKAYRHPEGPRRGGRVDPGAARGPPRRGQGLDSGCQRTQWVGHHRPRSAPR
jgi:transposase